MPILNLQHLFVEMMGFEHQQHGFLDKTQNFDYFRQLQNATDKTSANSRPLPHH